MALYTQELIWQILFITAITARMDGYKYRLIYSWISCLYENGGLWDVIIKQAILCKLRHLLNVVCEYSIN
jgi:hypothetical protein